MIVLDSDHINFLQNESGRPRIVLGARMAASPDQQFATTVITLEEQMRGWLALVHRAKSAPKLASAYEKLNDVVDYFARWQRLPFDAAAAEQFHELRKDGVRIGSMDLRIASIVLVNDALLLSANLRDFQQVPKLRVEDWAH